MIEWVEMGLVGIEQRTWAVCVGNAASVVRCFIRTYCDVLFVCPLVLLAAVLLLDHCLLGGAGSLKWRAGSGGLPQNEQKSLSFQLKRVSSFLSKGYV